MDIHVTCIYRLIVKLEKKGPFIRRSIMVIVPALGPCSMVYMYTTIQHYMLSASPISLKYIPATIFMNFNLTMNMSFKLYNSNTSWLNSYGSMS